MNIVIFSVLFLMRAVLVGFFSIGFIALYQRLYVAVFVMPTPNLQLRMFYRVALLVLTSGIGLLLHYGAARLMHGDPGLLYHNWALFLLTTPLFFGGFSKLEVTIQAAALATFWYGHHQSNWLTPQALAAAALIVVGLYLLMHYHQTVTTHWWLGTLGSGVLAAAFWLSAPNLAMGIAISDHERWWAISLYTLMSAIVLGYWLRQYRLDEHLRHEARIADYGTDHAQYQHDQQAITAMFANARQTQTPLTLVSIDLDHFKQINDRYGYLAGNAVLLGVSDTIRDSLQQEEAAAHLYQTGGEELNIVLPNTTPQAAIATIKHLQEAVRSSEYTYRQRPMQVTISIGITALHPTDTTIDSLYKRADDAVYAAKRAGRDTICLEQHVINPSPAQTPDDYRKFHFFAQGVYDLGKPHPTRYYHELLLRRYSAVQHRFVLPDDFDLPLGELPRLLGEILNADALHNLNINLTAAQFRDPQVAAVLASMMRHTPDLDRLTVEITAVADAETTRHITALYRSAGIKILIDDVGSDNSYELVRNELAYVDGVKFAMQNLRRTNDDQQMEERIAFWRQVAADNHLVFILEGVETASDAALAQRLGVQYVQGYYFDKPTNLIKEAANEPALD